MIKLMINDITSAWQTGNHGDTTLNKHAVPTGTKRERKGGEVRGEGTAVDDTRKDGEEDRDGRQQHFSSWPSQ